LYRPVDFGHHLLKCGIVGFSLIKSAADLKNTRFTKPVPLADRLQRGAAEFADKTAQDETPRTATSAKA
jgi:hypothetical protein